MSPHRSMEDFLILMWACCCWHVTGSLTDFVSPPELLLDTVSVKGQQCQGQCLGLPRVAPGTFVSVCLCVYCLSCFCTVFCIGELLLMRTWSGKNIFASKEKKSTRQAPVMRVIQCGGVGAEVT